MRLKNPFKKTGKGEARFRVLREDVSSLRSQIHNLQDSVDKLLARPGPDWKTYEHTAENRGTVRLVPRSHDYQAGLTGSLLDGKDS